MKNRKKGLLFLLVILLVVLVGCEKVEEKEGDYKEGTHFGTFTSEGEKATTSTAVVYVSENGTIESVYLDAVYSKDDVLTTKKTLGFDYGMKETSANIGNIEGGAEWHEQVILLEEKVVEEQDLDFIEWSNDEESETDSVAGVTIKVDGLYKALESAIAQAK